MKNRLTSSRGFLFLVTVLMSVILVSGCSQDLSRNEAREIIINHFKYPVPVTKELDIGSEIISYRMSRKWLETLKREGLINYTYHRPIGLSDVVSVSLTDEGKKYVIGDIATRGWLKGAKAGQKYVKVKLAEKQFLEITGLKKSDDKIEAVVEYTWKYGNFTPFSKGWRPLLGALVRGGFYDENKMHKVQVHMALYDDGWRIVE